MYKYIYIYNINIKNKKIILLSRGVTKGGRKNFEFFCASGKILPKFLSVQGFGQSFGRLLQFPGICATIRSGGWSIWGFLESKTCFYGKLQKTNRPKCPQLRKKVPRTRPIYELV